MGGESESGIPDPAIWGLGGVGGPRQGNHFSLQLQGFLTGNFSRLTVGYP